MKICSKLKKKFPDLNIIWLQIISALFLWSSCCYQGDEARPIPVSHVNRVTCHVISQKIQKRHVTEYCSCKYWIWCKNSTKCGKWRAQPLLQIPQPVEQSCIYKFIASACSKYCDNESFSPISYSTPLRVYITCNTSYLRASSSYCDNHLISNWCYSSLCNNHHQATGRSLYAFPGESHSNVLSVCKDRNSVITRREFEFKICTFKKNRSKSAIEEYKNSSGDRRTAFSKFHLKTNNPKLSDTSQSSPEIQSWKSRNLLQSYRPLVLRSSGQTLPTSPKENDTLSPAAGVIIYDEMNNNPANRSYLAQYIWEVSISLLYEDVYPGEILGTKSKVIRDGSNEILFDDIVITSWGYSYILKIEIKARNISYWNLSYLIGPFDVDKFDTFELPLIDSDEFRSVKVVFDNAYEIARKDKRKFEIFFLNEFGIKFPDVRWKNVSVSGGSIVVDSIITGLTENLDLTATKLESLIESDKANAIYEKNMLKTNKIFLPSRKLLEESGSESSDGGGGLSVAWIVAIVVNVILIAVFIIAIVYCYCRRKKQREVSSATSTMRNFDEGPNPLLFGNKHDNHRRLQDKAAIFTIEDDHKKLNNHRSLSGKLHRDDERCNCQSPRCYCSVGDGRSSEMTLHHSEEENEDDPPGYPTPSPEPKFPTPEPSPEPADYWRPDSYQQQEEEEPEEEEMFLPGAVSEPSPDILQEERFYVYLLTDVDGSRELVGQIYLKLDSFLSETRRVIDHDRNLSDVIQDREYRFLDENLDAIPNYQESSMDIERVFPSQGINIQYLPPKTPTPKPAPPPKPKLPAYVGPLGICNASDCTKAAKIKCLDCRNVAYCTKRCMKADVKDHRKNCFKPAWRL